MKKYIIKLISSCFVFLEVFKEPSVSVKQILLYEDEGASSEAIYSMRYALSSILPEYDVKGITAEEVKGGIDKDTLLFIMPGGRATPYRQKLYEIDEAAGNKAIKKFVEEGGYYLGLGAGAYYAGSEVLFDQDNIDISKRISVTGEKLLSFFPGPVIGPVFSPFYYNSHEGAKAPIITFEQHDSLNDTNLYCNGGGCFILLNGDSLQVQVIARYKEVFEQHPAIVECSVGAGKAVLCGVHPEYTLETLEHLSPENPFIQNLSHLLTDTSSYEVLKFLLKKFALFSD